MRENFSNLDHVLRKANVSGVNGILLDLGLSLPQFRGGDRGFSFADTGSLDMRLSPDTGVTAGSIVNEWPEEEIARIFWELGEERESRRIAARLCFAREKKTIESPKELADLIVQARKSRGGRIHPATRCFQALRMAVNRELENLTQVLNKGIPALKPGGRICVIAFHSLEDRIVKRTLKYFSGKGSQSAPEPIPQEVPRAAIRLLTKKPVRPSREEIKLNPRCRSAKLRAAERIGESGESVSINN